MKLQSGMKIVANAGSQNTSILYPGSQQHVKQNWCNCLLWNWFHV